MYWGRKNVILSVMCMLFCVLQANQTSAQAHEVSVRSVFESMGYKVFREGKYIKLTREQDDVIELLPNSKSAIKNGKTYTLTTPIRFEKTKIQHMLSVLDVYGLAKEEKKEQIRSSFTLWNVRGRWKSYKSVYVS